MNIATAMSDNDFLDEEYLWRHFAALNDQILEVRPIFDQFCARYKFASVEPRTPSRNPQIRLERPGQPSLWFDLRMERDRQDCPPQDLPYELSCGAILDDGQSRYYKILQCFSAKPFEQVPLILKEEMEKALRTLLTWDVKFLKKNGDKF